MAFPEDLARFRLAAEAFRDGVTALRPAAERASCSVSVLHESLGRLNQHYGVTLVAPGDKATPTRLTENGERLYAALCHLDDFENVRLLLGEPREAPRPALRTALSKSLFASPLLFPELSQQFAQFRKRYDLRLDFGDHFDLGNVLGRIERGELDVLLAWGLGEHEDDGGARFPDLDAHLLTNRMRSDVIIPPEIDVVFVAASGAAIAGLQVEPGPPTVFDEGALKNKVVVTVSRDLEPRSLRALLPNRLSGGRRTSVGSIETVLAYVRAGVADVGVVPAVYRELDHYRRLGQLAYSGPIAKAGVYAVTHAKAEEPSRHTQAGFLEAVRQVARKVARDTARPPEGGVEPEANLQREYMNRPCWSVRGGPVPDAPDTFFEGMRFGYYVDHLRDRYGRAQPGADPIWRAEHVRVCPAPPAGDERVFRVYVLNQDGARFRADGRLFANVFTLTARQEPPIIDQTVCQFRSTFSWWAPERGLMYGTWRGIGQHGQPIAYSTLWSHRALKLNDIQIVALHAMNTIGVTVNEWDQVPLPAGRDQEVWEKEIEMQEQKIKAQEEGAPAEPV